MQRPVESSKLKFLQDETIPYLKIDQTRKVNKTRKCRPLELLSVTRLNKNGDTARKSDSEKEENGVVVVGKEFKPWRFIIVIM